MFIFYILFCDNRVYYTGITNDIGKRLKKHLLHDSFYTKRFSSIKLAYTEKFKTRKEAAKRERQIKGWSNAKKAALVKGDVLKLKELSKRRKYQDFILSPSCSGVCLRQRRTGFSFADSAAFSPRFSGCLLFSPFS